MSNKFGKSDTINATLQSFGILSTKAFAALHAASFFSDSKSIFAAASPFSHTLCAKNASPPTAERILLTFSHTSNTVSSSQNASIFFLSAQYLCVANTKFSASSLVISPLPVKTSNAFSHLSLALGSNANRKSFAIISDTFDRNSRNTDLI